MNRQKKYNTTVPAILLLMYMAMLAVAMLHHELWGDEIHSWNIAKASGTFSELITNIRYEGHPPVWYIILWTISKYTHDPQAIQVLQYCIATVVAAILLFKAPLPLLTRALIPFGYFLLFEYGTLSRNYAIGILLALLICLLLHKRSPVRLLLYYVLLLLLSNTHLLAALLAASLHLYFLLLEHESGRSKKALLFQMVAGVVMLLPSVYFIFPPSDSELNMDFWISKWNIGQLSVLANAPLKAFIPVPAWWTDHFWNTSVLLENPNNYSLLKYLNLLISLSCMAFAFILLKSNKKSLVFFFANLLATFMVAFIFPLTSMRYCGFIFIACIIACWFSYRENTFLKKHIILLNALLVLHIIAGFLAISADIRSPFSNANKVGELLQKIPPGSKTVTDYWALNALAAFTDSAYYCIELQEKRSFLLWDRKMAAIQGKSNLLTNGLAYIFKEQSLLTIYLVSADAPEIQIEKNKELNSFFDITLVDKVDGAIEKGSNLYLYTIKKR